jgi:hypothetical protein
MEESDQGNHARGSYVKDEDLAEIERIAESWAGETPFEAVYELAKRFYFHLALQLLIEDQNGFEELKRTYGEIDGKERTRPLSLTKNLLSQLDNLVGFSMEDTDIVPPDQSPVSADLPDKEFFKNLGLD